MKKIFILCIIIATSTIIIAAKPIQKQDLTPEHYPLKGSHLENQLTCADCHEDDKPYTDRISQKTCFNCHDSYDELAKLTADLGYDDNIHASPHYVKMDCNLCHNIHKPSKPNYCVMCHSQETMMNLMVP